MREIKFRAWVKNEFAEIQKMVYPDRESEYGIVYDGLDFCIHDEDGEWLGSDDFEIMQFTGLRDSKRTKEYPDGQEIYEGNILRWTYEDTPGEADWETAAVEWMGEWDYPAFDLEPQMNTESNGLSYIMASVRNVEVIGNIHDNPELTEVTPCENS